MTPAQTRFVEAHRTLTSWKLEDGYQVTRFEVRQIEGTSKIEVVREYGKPGHSLKNRQAWVVGPRGGKYVVYDTFGF